LRIGLAGFASVRAKYRLEASGHRRDGREFEQKVAKEAKIDK